MRKFFLVQWNFQNFILKTSFDPNRSRGSDKPGFESNNFKSNNVSEVLVLTLGYILPQVCTVVY